MLNFFDKLVNQKFEVMTGEKYNWKILHLYNENKLFTAF